MSEDEDEFEVLRRVTNMCFDIFFSHLLRFTMKKKFRLLKKYLELINYNVWLKNL